MFGQRGIVQLDTQWEENFKEVLEVYDGLIKEGKIRNIGVSNENPYGVMKFLHESEKHQLPRIATIQNPYSLLNRLFEVGLSEICMRENVGLMAYSPWRLVSKWKAFEWIATCLKIGIVSAIYKVLK